MLTTIDPWLALEAALRGAFVLLLLGLAGLIWRSHRAELLARLAVAMAIGSAVYGVQSALIGPTPLAGWQAPLQAVMTGNPVVMWLLARALFDDAFELRHWHVALWLTWVGLGLSNCYLWHAVPLSWLLEAGPLLFCALALWPMLGSWQGDLVEGRPALRQRVLVAIVAYTAVSTSLQLLPRGRGPLRWGGALDAATLLAIAAMVAWPMLTLRSSPLWASAAQAGAPDADAPPAADPDATPDATAAIDRDDVALAKLERAMRDAKVYRREGLTIGALAAELGLPEYRLRRTINRQLGHRNFNAYLNGHRIADAKAALADPLRAGDAVLGIAIDVGFQSLGPFNRAFKAVTGLTPTEFRRLALTQSG